MSEAQEVADSLYAWGARPDTLDQAARLVRRKLPDGDLEGPTLIDGIAWALVQLVKREKSR